MSQHEQTETGGAYVQVHHGRLVEQQVVGVAEGDLAVPLVVGECLEADLARRDKTRAERARTSGRDVRCAGVERDDAFLVTA